MDAHRTFLESPHLLSLLLLCSVGLRKLHTDSKDFRLKGLQASGWSNSLTLCQLGACTCYDGYGVVTCVHWWFCKVTLEDVNTVLGSHTAHRDSL